MYFVQLFIFTNLGFFGDSILAFDLLFLVFYTFHHSRRRGFFWDFFTSIAFFVGSEPLGRERDGSNQSKDFEGYGKWEYGCWTYTIHQKRPHTYLVGYIQQKAGKTLLTRLERDIY